MIQKYQMLHCIKRVEKKINFFFYPDPVWNLSENLSWSKKVQEENFFFPGPPMNMTILRLAASYCIKYSLVNEAEGRKIERIWTGESVEVCEEEDGEEKKVGESWCRTWETDQQLASMWPSHGDHGDSWVKQATSALFSPTMLLCIMLPWHGFHSGGTWVCEAEVPLRSMKCSFIMTGALLCCLIMNHHTYFHSQLLFILPFCLQANLENWLAI